MIFRQARSVRLTSVIILLCAIALGGVLVTAASGKRENRVTVRARFREGQEFTYRVRYRERRNVRTESRVVAPLAPQDAQIDLIRNLRVLVLPRGTADPGSARLRVSLTDPGANAQGQPATLEFALTANGEVQQPPSLAPLSPEEQVLWRAWFNRFTVAWSLPANLRAGDKWSTEEPVSGSALAALSWQKESRFVEQQRCPVQRTGSENSGATSEPLVCAVVLTRATLKQRSSVKDATPEDYKLHELKTSGSARGSDEILSYIELNSGLLTRATDDSSQSMDVVIAKTDESNRVHYAMDAANHTEVVLIP